MIIKELNSETSYVNGIVSPAMSGSDVMLLRDRFVASVRGRHRFCFHQNPDVSLHDIIICYDSRSYIPPNRHVGKVESLIVLSGALDFYVFNDLGRPYFHTRLSIPESGHPFYVRVPPNTWHGLRAVGEAPCIIKETISGPYDRSSLQWASFSPTELDGSAAGFEWYDGIRQECIRNGISAQPVETFEQVGNDVYRSVKQITTVSLAQLQPIISAATTSPLKRARLCCHTGPEDRLQEMFIALAKEVSIDESVHLRKDESLTVINGRGRYLFPNEDGSVREALELGEFSDRPNSSLTFFARINRYVPHKIIIDTDIMLIHESTSGPFVKTDTDYRVRSLFL